MADLVVVCHEAYTILGAQFKETDYEYEIRYEIGHLFRMRKEITTNFEFKKVKIPKAPEISEK